MWYKRTRGGPTEDLVEASIPSWAWAHYDKIVKNLFEFYDTIKDGEADKSARTTAEIGDRLQSLLNAGLIISRDEDIVAHHLSRPLVPVSD